MSKSMTNERAIEILNGLTFVKVLENNAHCNDVQHSKSDEKKDNEDFAAIQMAISALEKQIPEKPTHPYKHCLNHQCPVCGDWEWSTYISGQWKPNYCPDCGQALDWSDSDE